MLTKAKCLKIYKNLAGKVTKANKYIEAKHCPMALESFSTFGSVASFCVKAGIGDSSFYRWKQRNPVFRECVEIGILHAREKWEKQIEENIFNEEFNSDMWVNKGKLLFRYGKSDKIILDINPKATPDKHYESLMKQGSRGDFTATEIKLLMESVNIGVRVNEQIKMQAQVDTMKEDLLRMNEHG